MKQTLLHTLLAFLLCSVTSAADFATEMLNATFKLFHLDSTGTCFLVQREAPNQSLYLVTAAHVLEGTKGDIGNGQRALINENYEDMKFFGGEFL